MESITLIPAYRPEDRMLTLLHALQGRGFTIVVVDDGSGDAYDAVFEQAAAFAHVERYRPNRGKGEALKHGLNYIQARFQPPYTVVTADADGQHRVEDIVKVCETARQRPDALVLGKRALDKTTPIKSRIGNNLSRGLYRLTTGRPVYETQTGLRGFSHRLLPRFLTLPGHRYEYEIDMLLDAADLPIIEVEIQTVYFDNNAATHFRPYRDTISLDKEFLRYKIPSFLAGGAGIGLFIALILVEQTWLTAAVGARLLTVLLKLVLNRAVPFAEKPPLGRALLSALILLICDVALIGGAVATGLPVIVSKLLASVLLIGVSIAVRRIWHTIRPTRSRPE